MRSGNLEMKAGRLRLVVDEDADEMEQAMLWCVSDVVGYGRIG